MSKRFAKIRYAEVEIETRRRARFVYESWNAHLEQYAKRSGTYIPSELKSDTKPLTETCLASRICHWIDEQGEDFENAWSEVLKRMEISKFLHKGYGNLKDPSLAWLFTSTAKGRGVERVLDGAYDHWRNQKIYSPDEGV